ncbi:MAG: hypothetical protein ABR606_10745 [Vicinamibacterales bacterium]
MGHRHSGAACGQDGSARGDSLTRASQATRSKLFGLVDIYRVTLYAASGQASIDALRTARRPIALRVDILYDGSLPDRIPQEWKRELMPALHSEQQEALARRVREVLPIRQSRRVSS